ncbi:MAG: AMP-binding protein, partial [Hyphomicrobiaceae bacterium]
MARRGDAMSSDNLLDLLEPVFARAAGDTAFEEPDGSLTTYGQLGARVNQFANTLVAAGVKPGDRVTAQVEKSLANIFLYLATLKIGAVFNPLNTAYTPAELDYFVGDATPAMLVAAPDRLE